MTSTAIADAARSARSAPTRPSQIDYKEVNRLRRYLSERAKIEPRRKTGTCAGHQRELAVALKRARHVALLPYAPAAPPALTVPVFAGPAAPLR